VTPRARGDGPRLRIVSPSATPEEVAAIVAAVGSALHDRAAAAAALASTAGAGDDPERLDAWVGASRLSARRAGLQRGPWRLSGRIGRRSRA